MAARYENTYTMPADINQIISVIRDPAFTAKLNLDFKSENPTATNVWFRFHHGVTFTSWGEKITITLTPANNATQVHIRSECAMPTQVADWGKNKQVVSNIYEYLKANTAGAPAYRPNPTPAQAAPQPQAPVCQQPVAAAQPQAAKAFCTACGKPLANGNLFCGYCGAKVQ